MSKVAKLTKLRSAIKRLPSISKLRRSATSSIAAYDDGASFIGEAKDDSSSLFPVYVGKSRRRYLLRADVIDHPMFKEIVDKSSSRNGDEILVACEVVLFEHLLWMLENSSDDDDSNDTIEELVGFYK